MCLFVLHHNLMLFYIYSGDLGRVWLYRQMDYFSINVKCTDLTSTIYKCRRCSIKLNRGLLVLHKTYIFMPPPPSRFEEGREYRFSASGRSTKFPFILFAVVVRTEMKFGTQICQTIPWSNAILGSPKNSNYLQLPFFFLAGFGLTQMRFCIPDS